MKQLDLFTGEGLTYQEAIDLTIKSFDSYGKDKDTWVFAFSGGKDSTATVLLAEHLISTGKISRPKNLIVLYADTRMELPPLHQSAIAVLDLLKSRGWQTHIVTPPLDQRFLVYMLGKGVPPPHHHFRWCTEKIKITPMYAQLDHLIESLHQDEEMLMVTGVRLGESAVRDQKIVASCSRDDGECGQGWFQNTVKPKIGVLAPLLHWRVCQVWDWLVEGSCLHHFPIMMLLEAYGGGEGTEELVEAAARTGCMGCPLVDRDLAIDNLVKQEKWTYLAPLRQLRPLYESWRSHEKRLRKPNGGRIGPLTLEARKQGFKDILEIQSTINSLALQQQMPIVELLDPEEINRINELIEAKAFPRGWKGTEEIASDFTPPSLTDDLNLLPLFQNGKY